MNASSVDFIAAWIQPVGDGADDGGDDQRCDDQDRPPPLAHPIDERWGLAGFADCLFGVTPGRRLQATFFVGGVNP